MKVLGYHYTIDDSADSEEIGAYGRHMSRRQLIQIASDLPDEQKISTLIHELIEALNFHLELTMDHATIMALETGLYAVLTENGVDLTPLLASIGYHNSASANPD